MKKYCPRCGRKFDNVLSRFCDEDSALLSLPDSYRLVGGALDGKYRIDALVGIGGFGAVYSAWHLGLDRQVAFKILQPNVALQSPEAVALFEGEAKTAARLLHENIVIIHDAGRTADGFSYIAMEWIEGRTLDEEIESRGRLGFERVAEVLRQTAAALSYAHKNRIVHRDLKPGNLMLIRRPDGGEQVKVVDFGIAKALSSATGSRVSRVIGTLDYAAPEQWRQGAQIDGRADIYSLGVTIFEALTGSLPFNAASDGELIQLKQSAAPPPLRKLLPDAPAAVEELLQRMMAVDPNQRPQDVGKIPAMFDAAIKPPSAPPRPETIVETPPPPRQKTVAETPPPRLKTVFETPVSAPPLTPAVPSFPKRRAGIIAAAVATLVLLGYGIWTGLPNKQTNISPPENRRANSFAVNLGNNVKLEMVNLPGGEFTMGSNDGYSDEKPPHRVKLGPFAIGKYEVTQAQWKAVMGDNPSYYNWADDLPVENVSWNMAQDFIRRLNDKLRDGTYRLPTEAEWEYAARAGSHSRYSFGDDASELHNYAWFYDNSGYQMQARQTHPVGRLKPNAFGLFDMHGNVWEWCSDWYSNSYYAECERQGTVTDPRGPSDGSARVFRGGGWSYDAVDCRSAFRYGSTPGFRLDYLGFRLLRTYR